MRRCEVSSYQLDFTIHNQSKSKAFSNMDDVAALVIRPRFDGLRESTEARAHARYTHTSVAITKSLSRRRHAESSSGQRHPRKAPYSRHRQAIIDYWFPPI